MASGPKRGKQTGGTPPAVTYPVYALRSRKEKDVASHPGLFDATRPAHFGREGASASKCPTCLCTTSFVLVIFIDSFPSTDTVASQLPISTATLHRIVHHDYHDCPLSNCKLISTRNMTGAIARPRGRPRKQPVASPATAHISSFARVSKQTTLAGKDLHGKKAAGITSITPITPSGRKRKAARSPEPEEEQEVASTPSQRTNLSATTKSTKKARLQASEPIARLQEDHSPSTPRSKPTRKRALSPSVEESPRTKEAGNLFKRLRIDASPFPAAAARKASPLTTSTPSTPAVPDSDDEKKEADSSGATTPEPDEAGPLPQELLDVVSLYTALLRTLSVHHAHNGAGAPVDLRHISQAVSLAWGKRRISVADVRRCVGVMDTTGASPFRLVDYGSKKICIEMAVASQGRPMDEPGLVSAFERNLRGIWSGVRDAAEGDLGAFVLGLPKASVQSCDSLVKASAMLGKGQRAMAELKKGIEARKGEQEAARACAQATTTADAVSGQKLSLLERLRLKETQLAQLAATGPTAAELERKAALQRAVDVAAVIAMLAKSAPAAGMGGRVSFTMATMLQKLKDSLRLPISKEEATACVRLLAAEVTPEWLKIVTIGGKENVVISVGRAPSSAAMVERVRMLSA